MEVTKRMSYAAFLASDVQMLDIKNPHQQFHSVNDASAKGINVPNLVFDSTAINRDEPGALLWIDIEDNPGEIIITSTKQPYHFTDDYGNPPDTDLPCYAELSWIYSNERAAKLIKIIKNHLENATFVEIWHYWIGDGRDLSNGMKKYSIHMDKLTTSLLEKLFTHNFGEYDCIVVRRK